MTSGLSVLRSPPYIISDLNLAPLTARLALFLTILVNYELPTAWNPGISRAGDVLTIEKCGNEIAKSCLRI